MRLVQVTPVEATHEEVVTASNFRLYDDNGELMRYIKSVSFRVDPSEDPKVVMVIERYLTSDDEIDFEVPAEDVHLIAVVDEDGQPLVIKPLI
jgi:hypothetical protein